jgi:hypothetical protein
MSSVEPSASSSRVGTAVGCVMLGVAALHHHLNCFIFAFCFSLLPPSYLTIVAAVWAYVPHLLLCWYLPTAWSIVCLLVLCVLEIMCVLVHGTNALLMMSLGSHRALGAFAWSTVATACGLYASFSTGELRMMIPLLLFLDGFLWAAYSCRDVQSPILWKCVQWFHSHRGSWNRFIERRLSNQR